MRFRSLLPLGLCFLGLFANSASAEPLKLHLRSRQEAAPKSGRFHAVTRTQGWEPKETAIVVCDMWDTHTCPNAALRVSQMAPRMNEVLKAARSQGVLIIHCPSNTMEFYKDHPGRKLAQQAPPVKTARPLEKWCYIDKEREIALPIDDTDGGCDCERTWKKGDPYPWTRQIATLEIKDGDAITDSAEAYYLMRQRGVKNLIVMGVHTNMCVLGRPFSIRQMVYQGMNVALMRDLTDTMYNPASAPYVSHFTGTDLVVEHIEKHWCPTLVSGDFLDGREYRFPGDTRPHVVVLLGEEEYNTATTLPKFAAEELGKDYRVSLVFLDEKTKASFPGVEAVNDADVLFISARRRPLPKSELDLIRKHVESGKPVLGIRTASHAFHLRNQPAPAGLADWPDIDAVVFGGSYVNHHGHNLKSTVWPLPGAKEHPILKGIAATEFPGHGGLYQTSPLKSGATELLRGKVDGVAQEEPVAWTFTRKDGGRSFYTSLGHPDDFLRPEIRMLLKNALAYLSEGRRPSAPAAVGAATSTKSPNQFVLFDATFTYTKEDADNSKPSKSHYYVRGNMLNSDRPKDWTQPVDFRNGTVHIRAEIIEKPAGGEPTTWTMCYIPNKGKKNGYGCTGTGVFREKGVYERDVSMTSFWQNDSIVWSEGIKQMDLVIKDDSGGAGHAHKRPDHEKFFPTKVRITMIQVAAGSKYDPSLVPNLPK